MLKLNQASKYKTQTWTNIMAILRMGKTTDIIVICHINTNNNEEFSLKQKQILKIRYMKIFNDNHYFIFEDYNTVRFFISDIVFLCNNYI